MLPPDHPARGQAPGRDPVPLHLLAGPWGAQVCHLTHLLHPEGAEEPRQGRGGSPAGALQCGGRPHRHLHPPGQHAGEDQGREDGQRVRVPVSLEEEEGAHGADTGRPTSPMALTSLQLSPSFLLSPLLTPFSLPPPSLLSPSSHSPSTCSSTMPCVS